MFFKFESQVFYELSCVDCFDESSIRIAFARSVVTVAVVKYDVHCRRGDGSGIPLAKVEKILLYLQKVCESKFIDCNDPCAYR